MKEILTILPDLRCPLIRILKIEDDNKDSSVCDDLLRTLVTSVEQQEGTRAREEFCTEMLIMTKSYYHYYDSEFRSATIPFISLDFLFPFFGGAWAQAGIDCRIKTKTP